MVQPWKAETAGGSESLGGARYMWLWPLPGSQEVSSLLCLTLPPPLCSAHLWPKATHPDDLGLKP
jgi:hypothetical protein